MSNMPRETDRKKWTFGPRLTQAPPAPAPSGLRMSDLMRDFHVFLDGEPFTQGTGFRLSGRVDLNLYPDLLVPEPAEGRDLPIAERPADFGHV